MDAYQDFCRDCCVRSLLNYLFALCFDLLISDGYCSVDIDSDCVNSIDCTSLD